MTDISTAISQTITAFITIVAVLLTFLKAWADYNKRAIEVAKERTAGKSALDAINERLGTIQSEIAELKKKNEAGEANEKYVHRAIDKLTQECEFLQSKLFETLRWSVMRKETDKQTGL